MTDKSGMFAFKVVDPGTYIVEMMGKDQTLLAASQMLNVNAGEVVSAIVKLPFRVPPFAGLLGSSSTSTAALIAGQAAATGIAAAVPTAPVSPIQ
jgi:galactokinase/mevalonate kinase-like predicted kinase